MKKKIQIFSDGSLNCSNISSVIVENIMLNEKDFKNSQFCAKRKGLKKISKDQENSGFRHKFLK